MARRKALAETMQASKFLAGRQLWLIQAKKRSTAERRGWNGEADLVPKLLV